jgi:hypothetical protein
MRNVVATIVILIGLLSLAPTPLHSQSNDSSGSPMPAPRRIPQLATWYPRLDFDRKQILDYLAGEGLKLRPHVGYDRWRGLDFAFKKGVDGGFYYLTDSGVAVIHLERSSVCDSLDPQQFFDRLGPFSSDQIMQGKTGRTAQLYVCAQDGISFTLNNQKIEGVELFDPMTLRRYLARIYKTPAKFTL